MRAAMSSGLRATCDVCKTYIGSLVKDIVPVVQKELSSLNKAQVAVPLSLTKDGILTQEGINQVPDIEYLIADPLIIAQILQHPHNKLKWAQCTFAGIDAINKAVKDSGQPPSFKIARQTGQFGQLMSEYVLGQIISRERNFPLFWERQQKSAFDKSIVDTYRSLADLTVGILGLGSIGSTVAQQCKAFNMTVWATIRDERFQTGQTTYENVNHIRPMSRLQEMLEQCDYLVSVLPNTPETCGLLSGNVLEACKKKKTVFVNIGRGDIIDDESLLNALRQGWLGGAILDVFKTEPLPSTSPLWSFPGVTISPHVSGMSRAKDIVELFTKNLALYESGSPLMNEVDFAKGY